ncbi:sugar transferase [Arenibacter sp. TNZ]|jgi:lipopolysaccharide/colanic/teichoic acid biosynthesis glycosyltransferase|uniref:sugar transferase n=1 Tax=Arenibacter TaxID=178469 RepID=UPI000CD43E28|nr:MULTISPECIES: sugar transferase [Arenibacter]MCM4172562.1 sugar transferase [Arenibacter sp. TNZ]
MYRLIIKRLLDLILALIAFILLLPIIIIITLISLVINRSNPFFSQDRPGKNEVVFKMYKFKSMTDKKDLSGKLLPDEARLTKMGNLLRKTSLDELPQLINVITGDMSLVGPRPLRTYYLPYYSKREAIRHTIRPGITGLAQVSGRNAIGWDEKLELDVQYVENLSFANDLKLIYKTILKVIRPSDVILDDNMLTLVEHRTKI